MKSVLPGLALALTACAARPPTSPPAMPDDPATLISTSEIAGDFFARQHIVAHHGESSGAFDAVVQLRAGDLTMIGLAPFGARAFMLRQHGTDVQFTSYLPRALPFPPRYMLLDLHRVMFLALPGAPLADGDHTGDREGEHVSERWSNHRLLERHLARATGVPAGRIDVLYEGGTDEHEPARVVRYHNARYGYDLEITTLDWRALP